MHSACARRPGRVPGARDSAMAESVYDVLGDAKKRAAYDEFGDASLQGGFDPEKAREYARWQGAQQRRAATFTEEGPIEFDFGDLFGRARGPRRGADLQ